MAEIIQRKGLQNCFVALYLLYRIRYKKMYFHHGGVCNDLIFYIRLLYKKMYIERRS